MNEYLVERKYPFKTGFIYDFVQCLGVNVYEAINKVMCDNNESIILSVYIGDTFGWELEQDFENSPYSDYIDCDEYHKRL